MDAFGLPGLRRARLVTWCALAGMGCGDVGQERESARSGDNASTDLSDALRSSLVSNAPVIGRPFSIQTGRGIVWVIDGAGDPALHALDEASGVILHSTGRRGSGPGEFAGQVSGAQVVHPDTSALWVFDSSGQRFVRMEATPMPAGELRTLQLQAPSHVIRAAWLDSATIVGVSADEDRRFMFFDGQGLMMRSVPGALLGSDSIPTVARINASLSGFGLCMRPNGSRFAQYFFGVGRVEIYDGSAMSMKLASVPHPADPQFEFNENRGTIQFVPPRMEYMSCTATDEHLILLYSGRTFEEEGDPFHGDRIHVFDWDGTLLHEQRLDRAVRGIAVASSGDLYGVSMEDAGVYRFRPN